MGAASFAIACTLAASGWMPRSEMMCPRYLHEEVAKLHPAGLAFNPAHRRARTMHSRWTLCSCKKQLYTRRSSRYTWVKALRSATRTVSMTRWNVAGAPFSPKGIFTTQSSPSVSRKPSLECPSHYGNLVEACLEVNNLKNGRISKFDRLLVKSEPMESASSN